MADLLTKCPACAVTFNVTVAQQRLAGGKVRCGNCNTTFNAIEQAFAKREITDTGVVDTPLDQDDVLIYDDMPDETEATPSAEQQPDAFAIPNPRDLIQEPELTPISQKPSRRIANGLAIVLLASILTAQYLHHHAVAMVQVHWLKPVVIRLCQLSGCNTLYQDKSQLQTRDFSVISHPATTNALLMSGQLANLGPYPQPFPNILITFENLDGHTVAQRSFKPLEYLPDDLKNDSLMTPRQSLPFSLPVVDPGESAQSYTLTLH